MQAVASLFDLIGPISLIYHIWQVDCLLKSLFRRLHVNLYPIFVFLVVYWLVVYLPLWKVWVRQLGWLFPIYGEITFMFQTIIQCRWDDISLPFSASRGTGWEPWDGIDDCRGNCISKWCLKAMGFPLPNLWLHSGDLWRWAIDNHLSVSDLALKK